MIKKSVIEAIATKLQIDLDGFEKAVTDKNEVDFEIKSEVKHFLTDEQKKEFEENIENDVGKTKYEEGKVAEREMTMKSLNEIHKIFADYSKFEKHGFDYENTTWTQFFDAATKKLDKGYESKIEALQKQIDGGESEVVKELQEKMDGYIKDRDDLKVNLKDQKEDFDKQIKDRDIADTNRKKDSFYNKAASSIPFDTEHIEGEDDKQKYLSKQKANLVHLFKNSFDTEYDENGAPVLINKETKEKMVDGIKNPLTADEIMLSFAKENYVKLEPENKGGRGGGSSTGGFSGTSGIKTMEDFHNYCNDKNIQPNSKDADALYQEVVKKNPEIK